ncbi:alpha-1,4-digalacturonate transport system permease protein [Labrenzia sp. EL_208]|uniref:Lactose transport system permease protein LacF n=2 Tax=Roseibium album TaxID=311410 RepID=A0A0M6ZKH3_9HYPH|nr:sugar ABC transporter permease [Roseibium album]MBG6177193.1 alpha-1,4-digalacturonate transport system permease protein [Labrenzia sp. EL_132]MBG6200708.1 alpha-1,4-digalacturonate transport system permease protein [Labrenzia sp. EL_13]MBG6231814.1 alpha-1,4-digalacturonate transport system permease protein [Labrenzia sp. EL_208]MCR9058403.1 sugar ABC transporter permease [Paracoccaceae bacterium]CTQ62636.1 Lactose transport system permease protein LacF [Roseibium album]
MSPKPSKTASEQLQAIAAWPLQMFFRLLDIPLRGIQKMGGIGSMPYVFLLPNLAFFGMFVIIPLFINFGFSLTGGTNLFLQDRVYVGGEQYSFLFKCENYMVSATCQEDRFWKGIFNTAIFVLFQVTFLVIFSLITAIILNRKIRARGFFRAVFFFPVLLSPVVVALIWKWILLRDGILNAFLVSLGLDKILFFVSPEWAMFWAVFVSIWAHMGFYTLILLAGLQAIPPDLYEAAEMDGTSKERVFWRITLPLLWPNMLVVIVLALIKGVQIFDEVYVLTGGGPGTATQFIVQYIYNTGFTNQVQNFGLASASSVVLGVVLFVLTMLQLAATRRRNNG